ncbi:uncharacterized protein LOC131024821 [Salvia miltiorrhiza]|uniref:uncharacterized protein LOC131024821 n=1 Tax=Salvia miltiorrhiza TaxID=226208 RepID=UPI0025ACE27B|nr:uncharacterized protein LOC131024821 [Salvia miltiorrhiza]
MEETVTYFQSPTEDSLSLLAAHNSPRCALDSSQVWIKMGDFDENFKHGQQDEGWEKTKMTRKAKRSRCIYSLEKPILTECDSYASNSKDPDAHHASSVVKSHNNHQILNTKTRDHLDLEVVSFLDNKDVMEMVLVDVQMSVNATPHAENAPTPFVSLTSEACGIAVIGYPLDVGEVRDESVACKLFRDRGRLVWRTSKRSPVCYVTSSPCKNTRDAMLPALLSKEKSLVKLLKNSNQGKRASNKTCVPVQLILRKIVAALD